MRDITNQQVLDSVNATIQGLIDVMVTKEDLRKALSNYATKEDLKAFATKEEVREIMREEVADIRDEQLRQGVLIEDMEDRLTKLAEAVDYDIGSKNLVKNHESRMNALESKGKLVISTVRLHSAQIKELQAGQK